MNDIPILGSLSLIPLTPKLILFGQIISHINSEQIQSTGRTICINLRHGSKMGLPKKQSQFGKESVSSSLDLIKWNSPHSDKILTSDHKKKIKIVATEVDLYKTRATILFRSGAKVVDS